MSERSDAQLAELSRLSGRGRAVTERRLRAIYEGGDDLVRGEAARFLFTWQSSRSLNLADEWLAQRPEQGVFTWIVICYALTSYADTYDRFAALFARTDLTDANLDVLVDNFASWAQFRDEDPRHKQALAIIASYLEHSSPQVRWTAAFSLGSLRATEYRPQLVQLEADKSLTPYGYVSRVARNAVRAIDGEQDVDLHDASSP